MASKYRARWRKYSFGAEKKKRYKKGDRQDIENFERCNRKNFVVYEVLLMKKKKKKKYNNNNTNNTNNNNNDDDDDNNKNRRTVLLLCCGRSYIKVH